MHLSRAQIFFLALCAPSISILAEPTAGENYRINFVDVDGNTLSTADGRITTLVLVNQSNIDKVRAVGDRTPDFCLGNSSYRMITVLAFETPKTVERRAVG